MLHAGNMISQGSLCTRLRPCIECQRKLGQNFPVRLWIRGLPVLL